MYRLCPLFLLGGLSGGRRGDPGSVLENETGYALANAVVTLQAQSPREARPKLGDSAQRCQGELRIRLSARRRLILKRAAGFLPGRVTAKGSGTPPAHRCTDRRWTSVSGHASAPLRGITGTVRDENEVGIPDRNGCVPQYGAAATGGPRNHRRPRNYRVAVSNQATT